MSGKYIPGHFPLKFIKKFMKRKRKQFLHSLAAGIPRNIPFFSLFSHFPPLSSLWK
ncbi:hypothetical protein Dsin_002436 [Dipteronia sinensis]|uniref:Uncharacterized protein n=1 Tax=Dipteronia sinensis TaxID=43782 RepID=A0AAE0B768_9ROSI|nr:hypothetical protein Dsin_002436 [Dipteronia sinensis]